MSREGVQTHQDGVMKGFPFQNVKEVKKNQFKESLDEVIRHYLNYFGLKEDINLVFGDLGLRL